MDIKVRTNISNEFQDIEVCINAPKRSKNYHFSFFLQKI